MLPCSDYLWSFPFFELFFFSSWYAGLWPRNNGPPSSELQEGRLVALIFMPGKQQGRKPGYLERLATDPYQGLVVLAAWNTFFVRIDGVIRVGVVVAFNGATIFVTSTIDAFQFRFL
ncbi:MAG: hypothetical protein CL797_08860 [Chromatiales bacterium]|jgi:hypothetical protein|nr:hypothetical protein [Chromatiales bacterium]